MKDLKDNINKKQTKKGLYPKIAYGGLILLIIGAILFFDFYKSNNKDYKNGYYQINEEIYYHEGRSWAKYNPSENDWMLVKKVDIENVTYTYFGFIRPKGFKGPSIEASKKVKIIKNYRITTK